MPPARLIVDVETFSTCDLKRAGANAYAEHPTTDVHCLGWQLDGARGMWLPGDPVPPPIALHIAVGGPVVAHNYLFELAIWSLILVPRHGWPRVPDGQWSCTMARALYHGLPASLEALSEALALTHRKDKEGHRAMLRMAQPRGHHFKEGSRTVIGLPYWWHDDPEEGPPRLARLYAYCAQDVAAEAEADAILPELPAIELPAFHLDRRINLRGIHLDAELIERLDDITQQEGKRLDEIMGEATDFHVTTTNQVAKLKVWLSDNGTPTTTLDKEALAEALTRANALTKLPLRVRQEAALASTAKLTSMRGAVSVDGRARGLFQYCGAGRTGRWAGRRVQPQNMTRPTMRQPLVDQAIKWALAGRDAADFQRMFPGTPMRVVSNCLRGCLAAPPGKLFVSVDLAQIEARVIAWLAGQQDVLDVFARGEDVYTYTATRIGSESRQLGKVLVLACGFGMGPPKFQATALAYGLKLTDTDALNYVVDWRDANSRIVAFWYRLGDVFKRIALSPSGTWEDFGFLKIGRTAKAVRIRLPSGRELIYHQVEIGKDGDGRDQIEYMGVHPKTGQWTRLRTYGGKLAENVTQAVARDVMAHDLVICDAHPMQAVGSIHDEGLFEAPEVLADACLGIALRVFRTPPPWAPGLPVGAEGWVGPRYKKG